MVDGPNINIKSTFKIVYKISHPGVSEIIPTIDIFERKFNNTKQTTPYVTLKRRPV